MRAKSASDIGDVCYHVCRMFQGNQHNAPLWQHVALMVGTGSAETGFMRVNYRREISSGLGLFSIEPQIVMYMFTNDLKYNRYNVLRKMRKEPWRLFCSSWLGLKTMEHFVPNMAEIRHLLVEDDVFAATVAYWAYLSTIDMVGDQLPLISDHWQKYYQVSGDHNKRKSSEFMDAWDNNGCNAIMHGLGYR